MNQEISDHQLVEHAGNFGESVLPWECVLDCSAPGQDASEAVEYWEKHPEVELPDPAAILRDLQETGAWDDLDESVDPDQWEQEKRNRQRYIWMAACDLREQWNQGEPIYIHNQEGL
jgi:hypothetical protein